MDRAGRGAILGYRRWLSHGWPDQCRHTPTCSARGPSGGGPVRPRGGGRLAAHRVRRCRLDAPARHPRSAALTVRLAGSART
ncbi:membrane protein insertion efficiency factor YidD [Micromonospora chersina]|uniref:membrane protein insertion efficiency factor YidD n=1 Tax=Micromonospora chersina TaxID=47854 RepID=UPI00371FC66E